MDKSQYRFPESEYNDASNRARLEAFRNTPEKLQAPFQFIKDIEEVVFSFRDTAVALEQRNGRIIKLPIIGVPVKVSARPKEEIYKQLIEQERVIGGKIYENGEANGYGFWLDQKGSSVISDTIADWHLEIPNPQDPKNPGGVHIETSAHHLKKFHKDGKLYPMSIQDIERFVPAAYHYAHEILPLYPFDEARADVLGDIDIPDDIAALLPPTHVEGTKSDYELAA